MNNSTEVIVIGGGVIGTSVAYYAAKAGKKVILLDRGDIAAGPCSQVFRVFRLPVEGPVGKSALTQD